MPACWYPRRAALMALAGPGAHLLLVVLAALALRIGASAGVFFAPERINFGLVASSNASATWEAISKLLSVVFSLNLLLFVFNLLPFSPLDGSAAITLLMSRETTKRDQEAAVSLIYPGVRYS